jgi:hypothetical protein
MTLRIEKLRLRSGTAEALPDPLRAAKPDIQQLAGLSRRLGRRGHSDRKFRVLPQALIGDRQHRITVQEPAGYARICRPCFWMTVRSLSAMPLGFLAPVSHFSTVLSLVLR